jgi:hypothetical protein
VMCLVVFVLRTENSLSSDFGMRSVVLGGGELATALSLSIAANDRFGAIQMRDKTLLMDMQVKKKYRCFRRSDLSVPSKPATHLMHWDDSNLPGMELLHSLHVALPSIYFDAEHTKALEEATFSPLQRIVLWQQKHKALHSGVPDASGVVPRLSMPPVVVFSRGLSRSGKTPAQTVLDVLRSDAQLNGTTPNVFVANGAFVPKEWAEHSSSIVHQVSGGITDCDPLVVPSPVTLSMAPLPGASLQSRDVIMRLFSREQTHLLDGSSFGLSSADDDRVGDIVGLVNALIPVISLGAGIMSNEYPSSLSALSSYLMCALESTSTLVAACLRSLDDAKDDATCAPASEDALTQHLEKNRRRAAKHATGEFRLPPSLAASIIAAATNQSSKEFAFGRQLRSNVTERNTALGVFGAMQTPQYLSLHHTIEGLSSRMSSANVSLPFYEKIFDAVSSFRRAEDVGKRLVSLAACSSNAIEDARARDPSSLLSIAQGLDRAIETGVGFDEAAARLVAKVPQL